MKSRHFVCAYPGRQYAAGLVGLISLGKDGFTVKKLLSLCVMAAFMMVAVGCGDEKKPTTPPKTDTKPATGTSEKKPDDKK